MLIQLCYCSKYKSGVFTLIEDIRDILIVAKRFNYKHNIHGTLYYADGSFLQCLEGEEEVIRKLYANILKDRRHENLNLLRIKPIQDIRFKKWTMKYVGVASPIKNLLNDLGFDYFVPELLSEEQLNQIIDILYSENEEDIKHINKNYSYYF